MNKYRITVTYDGSGFCGWQSQPSGNSIQDALEAAVFALTGETTNVVGSGRTDAGVHALGQTAHFCIEKDLEPKTVIGGLNAHLPRAVRVISAEKADENFDARKSAKRKTYMYAMYRGTPTPLLDGRALYVPKLDAVAMRREAEKIVGTHDFAAFMASGSGAKTTVRTVYETRVEERGNFVLFYVTANGFLYNMVRIIAAQLVKAGSGEYVDLSAILASRDRNRAKETAPAYGLYLLNVEYE